MSLHESTGRRSLLVVIDSTLIIVFKPMYELKKGNIEILNCMKFFSVALFALLMTLSTVMRAQSLPILIGSPDKSMVFKVLVDSGYIVYTVQFKNKIVIAKSRLGLVVNDVNLGKGNSLGSIEKYSANEKYPSRGVHEIAINHYEGAKITVSNNAQLSWILDVRVFNDGVAFRYIVDHKGAGQVTEDQTQFILPAGSVVWSQNNIKHYEGAYSKNKIEDVKAGDVAGPPITIQLPSQLVYAAITEAGLIDFAGMHLLADGHNTYQASLDGVVQKQGVVESPWRVIEIATGLNGLVNCDIIANVSPAYDPQLFPKGFQTDWIKPGKSVWSWLAVKRTITFENMKNFSDLASQLGFEYNLVDEGWNAWNDEGKDPWQLMKELVDYSTSKGVKIWLWKAYPDRKGIAGIKDSVQRIAFFKKCKEAGIAGVKIDFFDSENQEIIQFYQAALRDAAGYQLMVDFHGANKPTGESRTFPNEMSREGIRGLENRPPWTIGNTTLPFTRYLAGHADFTPVHFGNRMGETSWAHHLASMVIFTSPFLCVGADPVDILNNPCKEMMQRIPATWDETIVLPQSAIGELAAYARRKGNTWYIAAMNGNTANSIQINLSFLGKGNYHLKLMKDEPGKQASILSEDKKVINHKSMLTIPMNSSGGFVALIEKN